LLFFCAECCYAEHGINCYAECRNAGFPYADHHIFIVMLSAIILKLGVLSVVLLSVVMLSAVILNVVMLSVVMLSDVMLSAVKLNVVMLSVIMLDVVAPFLTHSHETIFSLIDCRYGQKQLKFRHGLRINYSKNSFSAAKRVKHFFNVIYAQICVIPFYVNIGLNYFKKNLQNWSTLEGYTSRPKH
jgi:hypothetical protein